MTKLFTPYTIRNVTLKNRIVMAPMCMYVAEENGFVTPWHQVHYISRAVGQVGLIMLEATAILPEGRISNNDLGIWDDSHIEGLKNLVDGIKTNGAKAAIQLAHAGRKAKVDGTIYAPSSMPFNEEYRTPQEMTIADIERVIEAFREAARRSIKAGFDVLEIHAAHGYLINQFLSPLTNFRTDDFGGSAENRYRLLRKVIDAVRSEFDGPLMVRISANDHDERGLSIEENIQFCQWMREQDVDFIDVSSGGLVPASYHVYPGYQVPFSEAIRKGADIPTGTVGLITTGIQAEEILQNGRADLIFIGRALLRDPYWPYHVSKEIGAEITAPTASYARGW